MIFKIQHKRTGTVPWFLLAIFFYLAFGQASGRKRLISTNENSSEDSIHQSHRSPLFESRNNLNTYQLVIDHGQTEHPQHLQLQQHDLSHEPQGQQPHTDKFSYVVKKKPHVNYRLRDEDGGQLYTIDSPRSTPGPIFQSTQRSFIGSSQSPPLAYYSTPVTPQEDYHTKNPEGKKYAFAYAVKPRDGYTSVADDFSLSHKESRDGKVTMGEYKVLLPDGRLQVVRYTADGKTGFKADVTYEGDHNHDHDHDHHDHQELTKPLSKPNSEVHKQFIILPTQSSQYLTPTPTSHLTSPFKSKPIFTSNPIKTHPSLSPSLIYNQAGSFDHHHLDRHFAPTPNSISSVSPHPQRLYKVSPSPYTFKNQEPTPEYVSYKRADASPTPFFHKMSATTPKNIYDKIGSTNSHYAPVTRGQRAGPAIVHTTEAPVFQVSTPSSIRQYANEIARNALPVYKHNGQSRIYSSQPTPFSLRPAVAHVPEPNQYELPIYNHPLPQNRRHKILKQVAENLKNKNEKIGLFPYEFFKAGPSEPPIIEHNDGHIQGHFDLHGHLNGHNSDVEQHDTHYILEEIHHDHPARHAEKDLEPIHRILPVKSNLPPVKSSLATFASSIGFRKTSKPTLYIKSKPTIPIGRPVKPSTSGLVYLETPGTGPRPTALGVKELLSRIPHDNLPRPKTTTHPYELGSKDYGDNVNYSPVSGGSYKTIRKNFTPSQEIPSELIPKHLREYLRDENRDSNVEYNNSPNTASQLQDTYPNYE